MAIELFQVVADQLKVGQGSPFTVRDEQGKLLLAQGSIVSGASQLSMLRQRALYVEVDDHAAEREDEPQRRRTVFERWKLATTGLDRLLASLSKPGFGERCDAFADELIALTVRDPDIAIYHAVRQDAAHLIRYGLNHALHCAMLGQLAATRCGWPTEQVRSLVKAALTMNLAIIDVQGLYARLGRLNDGQRARIKAHPQTAFDKLRNAGITDHDWLDGVLQHHERRAAVVTPKAWPSPARWAWRCACWTPSCRRSAPAPCARR